MASIIISSEFTHILAELHQDDRLQVHVNYSGRHMYGDTCFGIIHQRHYSWIAEILEYFQECEPSPERDKIEKELMNLLRNAETDNMGRSTITYFPKYSIDPELIKLFSEEEFE